MIYEPTPSGWKEFTARICLVPPSASIPLTTSENEKYRRGESECDPIVWYPIGPPWAISHPVQTEAPTIFLVTVNMEAHLHPDGQPKVAVERSRALRVRKGAPSDIGRTYATPVRSLRKPLLPPLFGDNPKVRAQIRNVTWLTSNKYKGKTSSASFDRFDQPLCDCQETKVRTLYNDWVKPCMKFRPPPFRFVEGTYLSIP